MRTIDKLGIFWLPGHEDDELTGRLIFDPVDKGVTIELVGWFESQNRNSTAPVRLLGWIENEKVTVDKCRASGHFRAPGPEGTIYRANSLFVGHHLEDDLTFDSVFITFDDLNEWIRRSAVQAKQSDRQYEVHCAPIDEESSPFAKGTVSLNMHWQETGDDIRGIRIRQGPTFKFEYSSRQDFESILKDVGRLEALIALCTDSAVVDVNLVLRRSDARVVMIDGTESRHLQAIEYLASRVNYTPEEQRKRRHHHRMFLDYEELGGIESVARWMDKSATFARPLDSLLSTRRARQMFMENRFMNITYAAEALHRVLLGGGQRMGQDTFEELVAAFRKVTPPDHVEWMLGKTRFMNEASLPKRLNKLAAQAGSATRSLTGNRGTWARTISEVRNELTHLKEGAKFVSGGDLFFMSESVYAVARVCMLLESGVSADVINRKSNERHMIWYKEQLAESIARFREHSQIDNE